MSKQAKAKIACGYQDKGPSCGSCEHRSFDRAMPAWMADSNAASAKEGRPEPYGDLCKVIKNQRCGLGGFAIKVMGFCRDYTQKAD